MKAVIEIKMDNAAFEDEGPATELLRILKGLLADISNGVENKALMDINGNKVGEFRIVD